MSKDIEFVDGLIVKAPHERAPDFVVCGISIRRDALIEWLEERKGQEWINLDVKRSREGKLYAAVNNFKREAQEPKPDTGAGGSGFDDDPIPF